MSGSTTTPREDAVNRTARIFGRACKLDRRTEAVLAATMEVSVTQLRKWGDPTSGARAPFFALAMLEAEAMIQATREFIEETSFAVVELPPVAPGPVDLDLFIVHQSEANDVIVAGLAAAKAGALDGPRGAVLERECDESIAATLRVREFARGAKRNGVARCSPLRPVAGGRADG